MHPTLRTLGRRIQLTTKDTNKGYYKGNRTGSMGSHTKYGTYIVDYNKVRTYVVPDLEGFKVCALDFYYFAIGAVGCFIRGLE